MINIIFCIFHRRDHDFYLSLAKNITNKNYKIHFLYFIDIPKQNNQFKCINFYDHLDIEIKKKTVPKKYLFHEKNWTFKNFKNLNSKYLNYKKTLEKILKKNKIDLVIQELGGFICHLSMFEASKSLNIKHFFIEPSFIKGHCFFLLNTLKINEGIKVNTLKKSKQLFSDYTKTLKKKKYFAINNKDLHLKKKNMIKLIISKYTIKAFLYKIKDLILNRKNEYKNLHIHLIDFIIRTFNYIINVFFSLSNLKEIKNFIYFPLHVPKDLALTLRAPECMDQIQSLKKILHNNNMKIIFKEHPLIFSRYNYFKIINKFKNSGFLNNNLHSNEIIKKSKFIITINSKAGLEALALGRPVMTLNQNYYCGDGLAFYCKNKKMFNKFCENINQYLPKKNKVKNFFINISKQCVYFDLYNNEPKSLKKSSESLNKILLKCLN